MPRLAKWIGYGIATVGLLFIVIVCAAWSISEYKVTRTLTIADEAIPVPTDSASVTRGRHLARAVAKCAECHGEDLGGRVLIENGAMGRIVPRNITRGKGGLGDSLTNADIIRAMRHGVGRGGRKIPVMPSKEYVLLSAEDVGAIFAYVRSGPPVDRELPTTKLGPVARGLIAAGQLPFYEADFIDHSLKPPVAPAAGATVEFGRYLASVGGCLSCHGPTLAGGKIEGGDPSWPPASNLTSTGLAKRYTAEGFMKTLRTGLRPEGTPLVEPMPWKLTGEMTDLELTAIWLYLQSVPPRENGPRVTAGP